MSFVFGSLGFSFGLITWSVKVIRFSVELRIGVCNFVEDVLENRYRHTCSQPHCWFYSNGSVYEGLWNNGKQLLSSAAPYVSGDVIGIQLNFPEKMMRFFKNGTKQMEYSLPAGNIFPCVALDALGDEVEIYPGFLPGRSTDSGAEDKLKHWVTRWMEPDSHFTVSAVPLVSKDETSVASQAICDQDLLHSVIAKLGFFVHYCESDNCEKDTDWAKCERALWTAFAGSCKMVSSPLQILYTINFSWSICWNGSTKRISLSNRKCCNWFCRLPRYLTHLRVH